MGLIPCHVNCIRRTLSIVSDEGAEASNISLDKATVREKLSVRIVTKISGQFEEQLENDNSFQT
jgi:hypothetical protein